MITVLLIEDEQSIRDMIRFALSREGIDMVEAADADAARKVLAGCLPDLILLDWMLPQTSGINLLREFKKKSEYAKIPIIMLTAKAEEEDKIMGLEAGADDYITKPFSPKELIARIKAVNRRVIGSDIHDQLSIGALDINTAAHKVTCKGSQLHLGPIEYRLLVFLASHMGRVYSRSALLTNVWSGMLDVEERTVDVYIRRLRKVLEPHECDKMIQTVRGAGYRLEAEAS
ncbi:MAG: phosphate regulon transcriptional regulator PhoB [Chromatiales bacterium]|jgi:two-component system phosphate regulon response regulator PhoB